MLYSSPHDESGIGTGFPMLTAASALKVGCQRVSEPVSHLFFISCRSTDCGNNRHKSSHVFLFCKKSSDFLFYDAGTLWIIAGGSLRTHFTKCYAQTVECLCRRIYVFYRSKLQRLLSTKLLGERIDSFTHGVLPS